MRLGGKARLRKLRRSAEPSAGQRLLRSLRRYQLPLQSRTHAGAIVGVHLVEQGELTLDDDVRDPRHRFRDVREQPLLLARVEQIEQGARLAEIVIADAVILALGIA